MHTYSPEDVYYADETGLFFQCLPDKTLAFKDETCTGGKKSKSRLTIMLATNMDGSYKLPVLVIGKAKNPRAFKHAKTLPVCYTYRSNKKAWMTSALFEEWLKKLARQMETDGAKLPATCVEEQIKGRRKDEVYTVNVLDALYRIKEAWSNVKQQCIANCFRHAGFVKEPEEIKSETIESDIVSVNQEGDSLDTDNYDNLFSRLNDLIPTSATAQAYLASDDDLAASEVLTSDSEDIVNSVVERDVDEEEGEEDEEEMPPPPPTVADAREAIKTLTLRLFIQSQSNVEDGLNQIANLQDYVEKVSVTKRRSQTFSRNCNEWYPFPSLFPKPCSLPLF
ncbi:tigger transposable element-derived protein 4-like [Elysia marginata]|uniref:Tigger transposable element-derived protein 4-like n=1 Tax=Elysia marginata TaxID=1093978 RepID=A0AAV4HLS8_9GAST|nr:tigger transposable element-derived protein 4-like [Elysia marginata]